MSLARNLAIASSFGFVLIGAAACSGGGSSGNGASGENGDAACGTVQGTGDNGDTNNNNGGTNAGKDAGAGATDSGVEGDGAKAGDGGVVADPKGGVVTISQSYIAATKGYSYVALAEFYDALPSAGGGAASSCNTYKDGACTVTACPPVAPVEAGAPPPVTDAGTITPPNAGAVTISGPMLKTPLSLTVGTTGAYGFDTGSAQAFAGADMMEFKADGKDVAAFDVKFAAPALLTVTAPTVTAGLYSFSRSKDLEVKFTGGDADTNVAIQLSAADATNGTTIASCSGASAGGSLTIISAALKHFPADATGGFTVSTSTTKADKAGDYAVSFSLTASAVSGAFKASD